MWELTKIVIPKMKAHWKDLAYCMRYSPEEIEGFRKDSQDLKECCEKFFVNWLTTAHGPTPKTYQTLLKHIKKINNLTAASEEIEKKVIKGKHAEVISIENYMHSDFTLPFLFYYSSTSGFITGSSSDTFVSHACIFCL